MTEATPLAATHPKLHIRAQMWWDALALQQTGRIRVTEVRGSDYLQAQGVFSFVGGPLLAGRRAYSPAPLDVPHSWTSTTDVATMLITAAQDQRAWGKAWHVPTTEPLTLRQLASRFTDVVGAPAAKLTAIPWPVMWTYGMFTPFVKELRTTRYQFVKPFILDSSAATRTFGLKPQSLDEALLETARLLRK
jgi:nucleoside-diphosphate-sugar epimerase